jgi:hypothetical protein
VDAIAGWDRFSQKLGIYFIDGDEYGKLQRMVHEPISFFRHVYGMSTLNADKAFAQVALWLVSANAVQSAAERTNKYVAEIHTKKRTSLRMEKGEAMLNVRMHEMYKAAQHKATQREMRAGERSIARDLKLVYERARGVAAEKRALQQQAAALHEDEADAREDEERLVTEEDARDVLGELEAPLRIPSGMKIGSSRWRQPPTRSLTPARRARGLDDHRALRGLWLVPRQAHEEERGPPSQDQRQDGQLHRQV